MNHTHHHIPHRDDDYLREIRAGGSRAESAITGLYKKYRRQTLAILASLVSRHPEYKGTAEDLLHDAFITMVCKIQFEPLQVQSLSNFWIGIGKKIFLNQLKKDERTILVRDAEELYILQEGPREYHFFDLEDQDQLEQTFSSLGTRCREILMLWINQFTMVEIAEKMGLSNDSLARKIKHNCFKKLKILVRTGNKMPG